MKLLHLSDLHLGLKVCEMSMLDEQKYIFEQIFSYLEENPVDAVLLSGDIYDKSIPPVDAVLLFDDILGRLSDMGLTVLIISGNHDSAVRFSFGSRLMDKSGIHFAHPFCAQSSPVVLTDQFGEVCIYMLPFVKPASVRKYFPNKEIDSYSKALKCCIDSMDIDYTKRNVLVAHQFVTGAFRSDSEEVSVGGLDNVDADVFDGIDYVALGHIHGPQKIGRESLRYSGTPLKYSFSECNHKKSLTLVSMEEKGNVAIEEIPLVPLHDMRVIRGTFAELCALPSSANFPCDDYVGITLTDEEEVPNGTEKLRNFFSNLMSVEYDNARTRLNAQIENLDDVTGMSPLELFDMLYEQQNARHLSEVQKDYLVAMIERLRGN